MVALLASYVMPCRFRHTPFDKEVETESRQTLGSKKPLNRRKP
jgi:hypothetical protein